ncbi:sulfonate transport system ATP-binding protein [Dysgonomonas alginatilytica]|uniref:Sulfonate transport system ATP-binding protein n=1 Tax=Dysgonomonas alginatilytica TaxID=1605892 RepID=A0A2V3PI86_9BACT|nr:ABC transporter ATP-binding protein [Dysgonomonas alginatilytica]PXV58933.1 sulfonate transport system ATP-binding protein [Dysgonomonas alginatilytica]
MNEESPVNQKENRSVKLSINSLSKTYQVKGEEITVLSDINLEVYEGEFVAIVGGSGCGKSTFLRIISGFIKDYLGTARINGLNIYAPGRDRGFVFQESRLFPWLTVEENIGFGLQNNSKKHSGKIEELLTLVGLTNFSKAYPHQLSGGMAQRCAIARALINHPEILLLDEPFGALDAMTKVTLQEELLKIHEKDKTTTILVTHDIEEAIFLADRVIVMTPRPGRIHKIIPVNLYHPRNRNESAFVEIRKHIYNEFFTSPKQEIEYSI